MDHKHEEYNGCRNNVDAFRRVDLEPVTADQSNESKDYAHDKEHDRNKQQCFPSASVPVWLPIETPVH